MIPPIPRLITRYVKEPLGKIPYLLIVGDKEVENNTVSVRSRKKGDRRGVSR